MKMIHHSDHRWAIYEGGAMRDLGAAEKDHPSFALLRQDACSKPSPWASGTALFDWLSPCVLELTYTAWDLAPFARDLGYDGPPFRWDEARRFQLRCELDAAFLHLYLGPPEEWEANAPPALRAAFPTPRAAAGHILDSFPIVQRKDEAAHGECRTKRVILEIYETLERCASSSGTYETPLTPPPADPGVAHRPSTRELPR